MSFDFFYPEFAFLTESALKKLKSFFCYIWKCISRDLVKMWIHHICLHLCNNISWTCHFQTTLNYPWWHLRCWQYWISIKDDAICIQGAITIAAKEGVIGDIVGLERILTDPSRLGKVEPKRLRVTCTLGWNDLKLTHSIHRHKPPFPWARERVSERCEWTSERTSEWPSTLCVDFITFRSYWNGS